MKILVCAKQVPDTSEIRIDPVTNTLIRDGVPAILNPHDGCALEAAARIKDKMPDTEIVVLSMGPPQAQNVVRECIATAADRGYLISGRAFGGSDTYATSYILSYAIRSLEDREGRFDAIFCGKQAIDGDTAQVGPEIAEHLDLPQVTCALTAEVQGRELKITKEIDGGTMMLSAPLPCVVTFTDPEWDLRFPTLKRRVAARKLEIPVITDTDLADIDQTKIGLKGSPTRVRGSFVPQQRSGCVIIKEGSPDADAKKLAGLIKESGII